MSRRISALSRCFGTWAHRVAGLAGRLAKLIGRSRRCVVAALLSLHRVAARTRRVGVWARRGRGSSRRGVVVSLHRWITVSRVASRSAASIPPCVAAVVCCYAVVLFLLGCCAAAGTLVGACVRDCPFWFFISVHRGSLASLLRQPEARLSLLPPPSLSAAREQ